jgi:hypothetical protein
VDFQKLELAFAVGMAGILMDFRKMLVLKQLKNVQLHVKQPKDVKLLTFQTKKERSSAVSCLGMQILSLQHRNLLLGHAIQLDLVVYLLLNPLMKQKMKQKKRRRWLLILKEM